MTPDPRKEMSRESDRWLEAHPEARTRNEKLPDVGTPGLLYKWQQINAKKREAIAKKRQAWKAREIAKLKRGV